MQLSTPVRKNGSVLAASSFAICALFSAAPDIERNHFFSEIAVAPAVAVEIAQTTANELLIEANRLLDEGWYQTKSGQYQSAIVSYEGAISAARHIGAQQQEAEALSGIGTADGFLGNYQQAIAAYRQAFSIYQSLGQLNRAASALQGIADNYWAIGNYSQAEVHFRDAIVIYQQLGDYESEQYVYGLLDQVAGR